MTFESQGKTGFTILEEPLFLNVDSSSDQQRFIVLISTWGSFVYMCNIELYLVHAPVCCWLPFWYVIECSLVSRVHCKMLLDIKKAEMHTPSCVAMCQPNPCSQLSVYPVAYCRDTFLLVQWAVLAAISTLQMWKVVIFAHKPWFHSNYSWAHLHFGEQQPLSVCFSIFIITYLGWTIFLKNVNNTSLPGMISSTFRQHCTSENVNIHFHWYVPGSRTIFMCKLCNLFSLNRSELLSHVSEKHAEEGIKVDDIIIPLRPLTAPANLNKSGEGTGQKLARMQTIITAILCIVTFIKLLHSWINPSLNLIMPAARLLPNSWKPLHKSTEGFDDFMSLPEDLFCFMNKCVLNAFSLIRSVSPYFFDKKEKQGLSLLENQCCVVG